MTKDLISRFTFRLPKALLERIKIEANNQGVSTNSLILQILWEWVKKNKS